MTAKKSASKSAKPARPPMKSMANAAAKAAARKAAPAGAKPAAKKPPQSAPYAEGKWAAAFERAKGERRNWLMKSEPEVFSFDDLLAAKNKTTFWDGVRNTASRNFLRDGIRKGDRVFFYHSNAEPSAIVGTCEVVKEGYPDHTAFDPMSEYYDAESDAANPMWFMVDVKAVEKLRRPVALQEIKANTRLAEMALIRVSRLAVTPVTDAEWEEVLAMSRS